MLVEVSWPCKVTLQICRTVFLSCSLLTTANAPELSVVRVEMSSHSLVGGHPELLSENPRAAAPGDN